MIDRVTGMEANILADQITTAFSASQTTIAQQRAEIAALNHQIDTWRELHRHTQGIIEALKARIGELEADVESWKDSA